MGNREAERFADVVARRVAALGRVQVAERQAVEVEALVEEPGIGAGLESDVRVPRDRGDLVRWYGPVDEIECPRLESEDGRLDVPVETVDDRINLGHLQDESGGVLFAGGRIRQKKSWVFFGVVGNGCFPVGGIFWGGARHLFVLRPPPGGARRTAPGGAGRSRAGSERS